MERYLHLGGTLFVPVLHKNLLEISGGKKYKNLKSIVIDTEDSLGEVELEDGLKALENFLKFFEKKDVLVFVRPRNVGVFQKILAFAGVEKLDGFVLPKFSLLNADAYLNLLQKTPFYFMPSIEGEELFESQKLLLLREKLLPFKEKIILIRFGLEDMLKNLKMTRKCEESIFDFSVTNAVLGNFLAIFKSSGFEISGGVFPCFENTQGFVEDAKRDLKEGLFSKTIIHPNQIEPLNEIYKVTQKEFDEANKIVSFDGEISSSHGKMLEKSTMTPYARFILSRAKIYGLRS